MISNGFRVRLGLYIQYITVDTVDNTTSSGRSRQSREGNKLSLVAFLLILSFFFQRRQLIVVFALIAGLSSETGIPEN